MNKNEQNRVVAWRLKVLREADEMPRGVAQTCRHFGLSRKTFYKWKARYKSYGEAGLCDRPRVPQRFPKADIKMGAALCALGARGVGKRCREDRKDRDARKPRSRLTSEPRLTVCRIVMRVSGVPVRSACVPINGRHYARAIWAKRRANNDILVAAQHHRSRRILKCPYAHAALV